jgi:acyl carrier protein
MLARVKLKDQLLELVRRHVPDLPSVSVGLEQANLSDAGLSSMAAVKLMLAIEATFEIAIPDAELTPENFATVDAIHALVARLLADGRRPH